MTGGRTAQTARTEVTVVVNGIRQKVEVGTDQKLLDLLRENLGMTGPKLGCGEGACGACTVLVGSRPVTACTTPVTDADGKQVTTVEGLAEDGVLHPIQQAWLEAGAMQCGYCTPGWLMATAGLLNRVSSPDPARICTELAGNVCRCGTYPRIVSAVRRAAEVMATPDLFEPIPTGPESDDRPPGADGLPAPGVIARPHLDRDEADQLFRLLSAGLVMVADSGTTRPGHGPRPLNDAWVHVGASGAVTAFTGKVEAGQGTRNGLALLVAEELGVQAGTVRMIMGDTSLTPFDIGTMGSLSTPYAAPPLRAAAAAARDLLVSEAARRLGLPAEGLAVTDGIVVGPDGAPAIGYGDLLAGVRRVEKVQRRLRLTPAASWRVAGHPAKRPDATDIVTGRKRFPADLAADGMRYGCILRPPAHGARLANVDVTAAQAMDGVTVVRDNDFIGVVADDPRSARRAITAIDATWQPRPGPDPAELAAFLRSHPMSAPGGEPPFEREQGDVTAALTAGPVRLEASYSAAFIAHVPLEPRCALAEWEDGQLIVRTGTSTPFNARTALAHQLRVREQDVRVIVPDYGGGFGGKHGAVVAFEAAWLARAADCPVKVQWSREEEFRAGYLRPAALIDIRSSASDSGDITGWSFTNHNSGAAGILTPYRIPEQRITFQPTYSPLPQGAYRALAATANHFARESHMDELAHRVGADPLEFRLRHLDDHRLAEVFRAAADAMASPPDGTAGGIGTGIAGGIEKGGRVATAARVRVDEDGRLQVERLVTAFDCGAVVNPDGLRNQVEGATMMALGGALFEAIDFEDGRILNASMSQYRVPRLTDLPELEVILLDQPGEPSAGGGETPMVAVAPAIANAVYAARKVRVRSMPLAPNGKVPVRSPDPGESAGLEVAELDVALAGPGSPRATLR